MTTVEHPPEHMPEHTPQQHDISEELQARVREAGERRTPLRIVAGGSKTFYGNPVDGAVLNVSGHTGIVEYQPSELVVTVRSGTRLAVLEAELRANQQMLAFEPPQHSENATIGGVIACGLSGPRRAACGSARDFVLGATVINGRGERCRFGGQVMKNVAGYDASRLMVGAQGTLGLLLDISIKVLPLPGAELSLKLKMAATEMVGVVLGWVRQGLPVSATCQWRGELHLRLSSTPSAVRRAREVIARDYACAEIAADFWTRLRDQSHPFFGLSEMQPGMQSEVQLEAQLEAQLETQSKTPSGPLWRCSHLPTTPLYGDADEQLLEWNGALRWQRSDEDLYATAAHHGGHAQRYPLNGDGASGAGELFQPLLSPGLLKIQQNLKQAFDPEGILNPGRVYAQV